MLVDTHAHLDSDRFEGEREQVIARAWAAGLEAVISVGTDLKSSRQALALAQQHTGIYATVGIHPHEAARAGPDDLAAIERLCNEDRVVAVGEIGLDYHYNFSPPAKQREWFRAQLGLARRLGKPVVIHDRDAHADTLSILREVVATSVAPKRSPTTKVVSTRLGLRGVLHCFSGDADMAAQALDMGFHLSFGGPVTFQNARRLQSLVSELPLERILLETDCPYLAPHPHRGKRNEPAYVQWVAAKIAELRGLSVEQVAEVTTANARQLFALATP